LPKYSQFASVKRKLSENKFNMRFSDNTELEVDLNDTKV